MKWEFKRHTRSITFRVPQEMFELIERAVNSGLFISKTETIKFLLLIGMLELKKWLQDDEGK